MVGLRISIGAVGVVYVAIGVVQMTYGNEVTAAPWLWPGVWIVAGAMTIWSAAWFRWMRLRLWAGAWLMLANVSRAAILAWSLFFGPLGSVSFTFRQATRTAILRDFALGLFVFIVWPRVVMPAGRPKR